ATISSDGKKAPKQLREKPHRDNGVSIRHKKRYTKKYRGIACLVIGEKQRQDTPASSEPGSQELNDSLDRLYERMRTAFTRRADYSAITATRRKTDESFEDYSMRMKDVFRKNSGIPYAEEPEGPYQQQLKQAIHGGKIRDKNLAEATDVGEAEAEGEEEAIPVKMISVIIVKIMDTGNVIVERNNVTRDTIEDSSKVLIHLNND
ncbi:hypothetical protein D4764_0157000, partial [Takifugu flavidus]